VDTRNIISMSPSTSTSPMEDMLRARSASPTRPKREYSSGEEDDDRSNTRPIKKRKVELNKKESKWALSLEELKRYKAQYGDCIVPRGFAENPKLASWVAEQRKQYKLYQTKRPSSITEQRIKLLGELGFAWNAQEAVWERHLADLKAYKEEHGDCLVPMHYFKYPKLGLWVKEQRRHYSLMKQEKQSHMTLERIRKLDQVGFCWDTHEANWGDRFRELNEYKKRHGNCMVPTNYEVNPKLGTWVHHQRRQFKNHKDGKPSHITEERIRLLNSIGFVWAPRENSSRNTPKKQVDDTLSDCDSNCSGRNSPSGAIARSIAIIKEESK